MGAAHSAICLAMLPTRVSGSLDIKYCSSSSSNSNSGSVGGDRADAARVRMASRWRHQSQQARFLQTHRHCCGA